MNIAVVHPYPLHSRVTGGSTRVFGLVRHLAERHTVSVFAHASTDRDADKQAVRELADMGVAQRVFPLPRASTLVRVRWATGAEPYFVGRNRNPALSEALADCARHRGLDVVHVEFAYLWTLIARLSDVPLRLLAEQETMSLSLSRLKKLPIRERTLYEWYIPHELGKTRRFEAQVLPNFDRVFGITPEEASILSAQSGRECDVHPHVVCTRTFTPGRTCPRRPDAPVLFVGNYAHRPNVHAVRWFVDRIWPVVRERVRPARLEVVGPNLAPDLHAGLERAGVTVRGRVEDLVECYRSASVFVNPIASGAGMRGKVLEAFACGVPVVSTAMGMEGIAAEDGRHYLRADSEAEFAGNVVRYLSDRSLAEEHGRTARALVTARYDSGTVFTRLESVFEEEVACKRTRNHVKAIA